jgi:hypothetical protein
MKGNKTLVQIYSSILLTFLILFSTSVFVTNAQEESLLTISKERIDVPISNLTVGWTDSRNIFVSGTASNNSTHNLDDVVVDVSIFDKNDELINKENRFVIPPDSILEAGSIQEFKFFVIADGAVSYNVSAYGSKVS